jgi:hypothetical protein
MTDNNTPRTLWVLQRNWRGFTRQKQESLLNSTLKEAGPKPDIILLIDTHLADKVAIAHHNHESATAHQTSGMRRGFRGTG